MRDRFSPSVLITNYHAVGHRFNYPKLHALQHYVDAIKEYGTTDNYNTETTERLHIDYVKDAYGATNKKKIYEQMIAWLDRKERTRLFAQHLQYETTHLPPPPLLRNRHTKPTITVALVPKSLKVSYIVHKDNYDLPDFQRHLAAYFDNLQADNLQADAAQRSRIAAPKSLDVWQRIKFTNPNPQLDSAVDFVDVAVAAPPRKASNKAVNTLNNENARMLPAQYDPILVHNYAVDADKAYGVQRKSSSVYYLFHCLTSFISIQSRHPQAYLCYPPTVLDRSSRHRSWMPRLR